MATRTRNKPSATAGTAEPTETPPAKARTRRRSTAKPRAPRTTLSTVAASLADLQQTVAALAEEVRELRKAPPSRRQGHLPLEWPGGAGGDAPLEDVSRRLQDVSERLATSLAETPTAADFQPLADHLYAFAETAPRLVEALEGLPNVVGSFDSSTKALQEVAETLQYTHQSFADSLLTLPRAEDYEPLAGPLREFAKVSPLLAESLSEVLKVAAPLASAVRNLEQVAGSLEASRERLEAAPSLRGGAAPAGEMYAELEAIEVQIGGALAGLPADAEYGRFAAQLREIASVSPSLMEWLEQVPRLSQPLAGSVADLAAAATRLRLLRERLSRG
jgi:hypothetical protein